MSEPVLKITDLQTHFRLNEGDLKAVKGVSIEVERGKVLGLVGESGSGKSVMGFSIIRLISSPGRIAGGSIRFNGRELTSLSDEEMRRLRGDRIAMVFQDPMMTLNPVLRLDTQIEEAVLAHHDVGRAEARRRAVAAFEMVGIPSPTERLKNYPHQFSGGMRQRVAIAIGLINRPDLIIADEPTTALDVTIQAQIISEVQKIKEEAGTALIWITHDLSVVAGLADNVAVMYAGRIVEQGPVDDVLDRPAHPYTRGLIDSIPSSNSGTGRLNQIDGMAPNMLNLPKGCPFKPRCSRTSSACDVFPERVIVSSPDHTAHCHHPLIQGSAGV